VLLYLDSLAQGSKQRGRVASIVISITSPNSVFFKLSGCAVTQQDIFQLFGIRTSSLATKVATYIYIYIHIHTHTHTHR
jgi:hypothetical protein